MLEQQRLQIGVRQQKAGGGHEWPITDADSGAALGCVRSRTSGAARWRRWFARPVWQVHEGDDESLLMTLQGAWLWSGAWDVYDAQPRQVGSIQRGRLVDGDGVYVAAMEFGPDRRGGRIRNWHGLELASFQLSGGAATLTFLPALEGDPFAKMLVLAAALASSV